MFAGEGKVEAIRLPAAQSWSSTELLNREFAAVGFYLSAHPLDAYRHVMERDRVQSWVEFEHSVRAGASAGRLAGMVVSKQERRTRTGKKMGIVMLSDPSGQYEAVIFEEGLARYRADLEPGAALLIDAGGDLRPEGVSVRIQSVRSLEQQASRVSQDMRIFLHDEAPVANLAPMVTGMARPGAEGKVSFVIMRNAGEREIEIELNDRFEVNGSVASAIKAMPGVDEVEVV